MSTVVLEAPRTTKMPKPVFVEIQFSKKRSRTEPKLEIMDDMVELVEAVIGLSTPLAFPAKAFTYESLTSAELEIVRQYKITIIEKAVRLVEDREDAQAAYLALYVIAMFRFDLTMKGLTDLVSRIDRSGSYLRDLCHAALQSRDPRYKGSR